MFPKRVLTFTQLIFLTWTFNNFYCSEETSCQGNFYKGKHLIVLVCLCISGLIHYHGEKHGGIQSDTVLEKELRVLTSWLTGNRKWSETLGMAWASMRPQNPPLQWYTSSTKATPTPTKQHLLIVPLSLGAIFFPMTTKRATLRSSKLAYPPFLQGWGLRYKNTYWEDRRSWAMSLVASSPMPG